MAEVALEQVTKTYDGAARAVDHVSLTIADQEFVVLVGPSGCGKSTLLRMIAGLEAVTEGTISIGGRVVNDVLPKDRDVAMVFQNYALYPHMSVRQNMAFGLKLRKLPRREIDERIESAAKMLAIEELLQRKPRELSGGQRQRVAVGRAIVRQPAVFLFDEPLSNLDALRRTEMRRELAELHRRLAATIVYVTHDQVEAMTLGDRIVVMNAGQIQQVGRPLELYDHPANRFVAGFLGSPPMNFLDGKIVSEQRRLQFRAEPISLPLSEELSSSDSTESPQLVTLGIRPEHLTITSPHDNAAQISATIEDIQPLGGESLIYLNTGASQWVLRTDAHHDFTRGQQVNVAVEMSRAHLFDSSGQAIRPRTPTVDQAR